MQSSFGTTLAFTRAQEGPYSVDPSDSGNWSGGVTGYGELIGSCYGCSAPVTIDYMRRTEPGFVVTAEWMEALPIAVFIGIATMRYWTPLECALLLPGLDLSVFDFGWNTGVASSAKRLQWLIGAKQDGEIGPGTEEAIAYVHLGPIVAALSIDDIRAVQRLLEVPDDGQVGTQTLGALAASGDALRGSILAIALAEAQGAYYRSCRGFSIDGQGWLNRTNARMEAALKVARGVLPAVGSFLTLNRSRPALEAPGARNWMPFEEGIPIRAQAGRLVPSTGDQK